ncbi:MAG: polysaccharide biosynthesis tyrosine autokinase [Terrimicrobiaceae bacterium]|nr:polysaccharide biosynthesis tyrosine autokinase [Terrimicrobiaceae bacterium]
MNEPPVNKLHLLDYLRVVRVRWPIMLVIFLLVVVTTATITFLLPKQYESTALIQVQQNADFEIFQQGGLKGTDPRFTTTQFEIIQSKEVLQPVIEKLNLAAKWAERYEIKSRELIYKKLKKMMSLEEERNTDLISISILSPDKQEAADIANGIADSYQQARIHEQQSWVSKSLSTLEAEVEKQRTKTEKLRTVAAENRVKFGINDLNPESVEDPMQANERVLMSVEEEVSTQRLKTAAWAAKYDQISKMSDDQIMASIATLEVEDQTIHQILPLYQEAASEAARLIKGGYGLNHPMVQSQTAKKETYWKQLTGRIEGLRVALLARLNTEKDSLKNLEEKLNESRAEQQTSKTRASSYYEAKNNYIQAKKVLEAAETRFWTEMMQRSMPLNPAIIWEHAEVAEYAARPRIALNLALGVFFGLVLGMGVAFFIEYLDTSVKTMEDIETYFGLPVLAVVPRGIGVLMDLPPDAPDAEPYRILRTNVEFNKKDPDAKVITLVSGGPGEGKSTTLVNLAYAFAQSGLKTLVVDADLRRPRQHQIFAVSNAKGLTDYLSKGVPIDELIQPTKVENLQMVPSGKLPPGAIAMLNSRRMLSLISELKKQFDMILIDAPPILGVSDSSVIVRAVDLTIIVIQHRRFPRSMLLRVKNGVLNAGGNLLGAVLNNVDIRLDQYYQYQTNYYSYHQDPAKEAKSKIKADKQQLVAEKASRGRSRDEY